jgi:hypothetical protein
MIAPETLWARKHPIKHGHHWHDATSSDAVADTVNTSFGTINLFVRYVRADLPPPLSAAMELPEVRALVDAARKVRDSYWYSSDGIIQGIYDLERTLAALPTGKGGD